ncbi:hypothetical protein M427DRAFT_141974, partial [Gonapodya prolifera JEL478]
MTDTTPAARLQSLPPELLCRVLLWLPLSSLLLFASSSTAHRQFVLSEPSLISSLDFYASQFALRNVDPAGRCNIERVGDRTVSYLLNQLNRCGNPHAVKKMVLDVSRVTMRGVRLALEGLSELQELSVCHCHDVIMSERDLREICSTYMVDPAPATGAAPAPRSTRDAGPHMVLSMETPRDTPQWGAPAPLLKRSLRKLGIVGVNLMNLYTVHGHVTWMSPTSGAWGRLNVPPESLSTPTCAAEDCGRLLSYNGGTGDRCATCGVKAHACAYHTAFSAPRTCSYCIRLLPGCIVCDPGLSALTALGGALCRACESGMLCSKCGPPAILKGQDSEILCEACFRTGQRVARAMSVS